MQHNHSRLNTSDLRLQQDSQTMWRKSSGWKVYCKVATLLQDNFVIFFPNTHPVYYECSWPQDLWILNKHYNSIFTEIQTKRTDTTAPPVVRCQHAINCGHRMSTRSEENLQVPATAEQGQILQQPQLSTRTAAADARSMTRSAMLLH